LHTGTFPLENWSPEVAEDYTGQLADFLKGQQFTRHADLAAVQPLLNRVAKNSDRLTVLIFCDSRSRLAGTPYDSGVNEIITNTAARLKGGPTSLILVLRAYHGEYLGCSVNRSAPLNFPKFPPPPKPAPAPVVKATPAPVPAPPPVSAPVPSLIIVGTNASTNASAAINPAVTPASLAPAAPRVTPPATPVAATSPASIIVTGPPLAPAASKPPVAPPPVPPVPTLVPALPTTSAPETAVVSPSVPPAVAPASEPNGAPSNPVTAAAETVPTNNNYVWAWLLGGGALAVAAVLVLVIVTRTRRPHGSLISSSMQNDPRLPPRR
jgi:hypothetical protein